MKKTRKTLVSLILAVAMTLGLSTMFVSAAAEQTGAIIIPMECTSYDWIRNDDKEAIKLIQQTDKRRAMFYNTNTHYRWGTKESYNLMVDSGALGIDTCVQLICDLATKK